MSTITTNYGLTKDAQTDYYNIDTVNQNLDKIDKALGNGVKFSTAGGSGTAITLSGIILEEGESKTFIASASNNGAATTINSIPLFRPGTTTAPNIISGKAYTVWYNKANNRFFLKASAEGTAVASQVLAGETFSNYFDTNILGTYTPLNDVDSGTGTTITSNKSDDGLVEVTKIEGVTTVTPANPSLPISPDNVAVIKSSGDFSVVSSGKNLFDNTQAIYSSYQSTVTLLSTGIKVKSTSDGTWRNARYLIQLKPSTKYHMYFKATVISGSVNLSIRKLDGTTNLASVGMSGAVSFTADSTGETYFDFYCTVDTSSSGEVDYTNIQLEEGTVATTYTPYQGNYTQSIPYTLYSTPNGLANDIILNQDGTKTLTRRLNSHTINQMSSWTVSSSVGSPDYAYCTTTTYDVVFVNGDIALLCNRFKAMQTFDINTVVTTDSICIDGSSTGKVRLLIKKSRLATLNSDGLTSWLTNNPLEVIFQLATPTTSTVTEDFYLPSYSGQTTVTTSATSKPKLTVNFKSELWSKNFLVSLADATSDNVLANKSFVTANGLQDGTMPNYSNSETTSVIEPFMYNGALYMQPPKGYYNGEYSSRVKYPEPDLVPTNIVYGKNIFGVVGTATGTRYVSGTVRSGIEVSGFYTIGGGTISQYHVTITQSFGFTPSKIILYYKNSDTNYYTLGIYMSNAVNYTDLYILTSFDSGGNIVGMYMGNTSPAYVTSNGFRLPIGNLDYEDFAYTVYE